MIKNTFDPIPFIDAAPLADSFFAGFEEHVVPLENGHLFCRTKGDGVPLVLIHGYPQTSAMWHEIAPELSETYRVICLDLRGYGRSAMPQTDAEHTPYTKRAMAQDIVGLMDHFGHDRFLVGSHDRGSRVAHRLAADHADRVLGVAMLDIAPTREMYRDGDSYFAAAYWHWFWLIQPAPFPEMQIGHDPKGFWIKKCCIDSAGHAPFKKQALIEYLDAFDSPAAIHGSCEDYRAAFTTDIAHDDADPSKLPMPLHVSWGADGVIEKCFDCLALWRERAEKVEGCALPGGHYLAEEEPRKVLDQWLPFFERCARPNL